MSKKVIIEFSLIREGEIRSNKNIIEDIRGAFDQELILPWCGKVEKIRIDDQTPKELQNNKISCLINFEEESIVSK